MANVNFNSLKDLEKFLMDKIEQAMHGVAKDGENTVKTFIQSDVYDSYTPEDYKRTGELKSSVTNSVTKVETYAVEAKIFHDLNEIRAIAPSLENNRIGQHHSTVKKYEPQDYRLYIIETVNYGIDPNKKHIFGDGVYSKARPYMDNARRSLRKDARNLMMNEFRSMGIKTYIY
jgi:hypothetical protein